MNTATVNETAATEHSNAPAETRQTLAELVNTAGIHAEAADDSGGVRLFTSQDATGYAHRAAFSLADYAVDAVCGPFVHLRPRDQKRSASGHRLYSRGVDGYAVGPEGLTNRDYPVLPVAVRGEFQGGANHYGSEKPMAVHGWAWSSTFGRWGALVTFCNGWHGFTWAATY